MTSPKSSLSMSVAKAVRNLFAASAMTLALGHQAAVAGAVFQSVADLSANNISQIGWCSSCDGSYRIFDQFALGSSETITGFTVSAYSLGSYWPSDVNFSIWTVGGGGDVPGVQLFSQTIAAANFTTTTLSDDRALLATTDDVTGLTLGAGTYYVSFYNPSRLAINGYVGGGGNLYQEGNTHHAGTSAGFILFNDATNSVPEPSTMLLTSLAILALGVTARRRRA